MSDTSNIILIGAIGVGAYFLYKQLSPNSEKSKETLRATADTYYPSKLNPGATNVSYRNTTYQFTESDFEKFNLAQRFLVELDKAIIPGTWLTRRVLS